MTKSKGNILIVDNEPNILEFMGEILEAEGYSVLLAEDGDTGLKIIKENDLNLVFLDLRFPRGMDGIDVLREALRVKSKLQIVVISGKATIKDAIAATRLGAYDLIEKDYLDQERLLVVARRAIEKDIMQTELETFKKAAQEKYQMVGTSNAIQRVYRFIEKSAPSKAKVLIIGESGVGKELVARAIHFLSPRAAKSFQKLNCAAIPSELIESELFGIEKEIATGVGKRIGKFEQADGGTIFLDEIADMSLMTQAKVLRVLQGEEFQRVGGNKDIKVDVRVIAATKKDLKAEISEGNFREDLFYRLNVITIPVPTLEERKEDIPLLLDHYLQYFCEENNMILKKFSSDAVVFLTNYQWEGNIRELKNLVEKLVVLTDSEYINRQHVLSALENVPMPKDSHQVETLRKARMRFERNYILDVLNSQEGNTSKAAEVLGIDRTNLYRKMRQLGIHTKT